MPYRYHWNTQYVDPPPRWIRARFLQKCACGATIQPGDRALYYSGRRAHNCLCSTCGAKIEQAKAHALAMQDPNWLYKPIPQ